MTWKDWAPVVVITLALTALVTAVLLDFGTDHRMHRPVPTVTVLYQIGDVAP